MFMKTLRFTLFFAALLMLIPFTATQASEAVSAKEARENAIKKMSDNGSTTMATEGFMAKKVAKVAKWFNKKGGKIDFQHPVDKFRWFAIAGWLAGALLYSLFWGVGLAVGLYFIAYLCWLAGSVCFVVWILKKTGAM